MNVSTIFLILIYQIHIMIFQSILLLVCFLCQLYLIINLIDLFKTQTFNNFTIEPGTIVYVRIKTIYTKQFFADLYNVPAEFGHDKKDIVKCLFFPLTLMLYLSSCRMYCPYQMKQTWKKLNCKVKLKCKPGQRTEFFWDSQFHLPFFCAQKVRAYFGCTTSL